MIVLVTQETILFAFVRLLGCLLFRWECLAAVRTANESSAVAADVGPVSEFLAAGALSGFSPFRIYVVYAGEEPGVSGEFLTFNYYQYRICGAQPADIGDGCALYCELTSESVFRDVRVYAMNDSS